MIIVFCHYVVGSRPHAASYMEKGDANEDLPPKRNMSAYAKSLWKTLHSWDGHRKKCRSSAFRKRPSARVIRKSRRRSWPLSSGWAENKEYECHWYLMIFYIRTSDSFSAVSTPIFASTYSFFRIFRDLQDVHSFAPLQSQQFSKFSSIFLMIC